MSQMSELDIDIRTMLDNKIHPTKIAKQLQIPLTWVYDTLENMDDSENNTEVFSPFETMNS
jgi:hypothetical protein